MKKTTNSPFLLFILLLCIISIFSCEEKGELITPNDTIGIDAIEETVPLGKVKDITVTLEKELGETDNNKRLRILIKEQKRKPQKRIIQKEELGFQ